ncbi:hypothetical protein B0H16DRAFT_1808606 [Mycena metata]|uniref:Uncharacterized protein n=1 Tax=Mycena metata TaxID=1033252 RepID=A0AAD7JCR6_9AGAR|nr:hypothetical protein B0H16DRAFT_1808606 [Mycena metata]
MDPGLEFNLSERPCDSECECESADESDSRRTCNCNYCTPTTRAEREGFALDLTQAKAAGQDPLFSRRKSAVQELFDSKSETKPLNSNVSDQEGMTCEMMDINLRSLSSAFLRRRPWWQNSIRSPPEVSANPSPPSIIPTQTPQSNLSQTRESNATTDQLAAEYYDDVDRIAQIDLTPGPKIYPSCDIGYLNPEPTSDLPPVLTAHEVRYDFHGNCVEAELR